MVGWEQGGLGQTPHPHPHPGESFKMALEGTPRGARRRDRVSCKTPHASEADSRVWKHPSNLEAVEHCAVWRQE